MREAEAAFGVAGAGAARPFAQRVIGAVRLDPETWDEIAGGDTGLGQAALVVLGSAAAASLAAASAISTRAAIESASSSLLSWLWMGAFLWVAANALGHRLRVGTALRVVGFAMAPLALLGLTAIPVPAVQAVVRLIALALFLAALVAGTRQALRVETMRAAFVCAIAGLAILLVLLTMLTVIANFLLG
jgi:hypothetical protein